MSGCCVTGCTNRYSHGGLKFYRIPTGSRPFQSNRRRLWLQAIKRADWNENVIRNARVCSAHFISGEASLDSSSPDFVPSVFTCTKRGQNTDAKTDRYPGKRRRAGRAHTAASCAPPETPERGCCMDHCPGCPVEVTSTVSARTCTSASARPAGHAHRDDPVLRDDPALRDHDYCPTTWGDDARDVATRRNEPSCFVLGGDADARLRTGLAPETLDILVSTLEGCAGRACHASAIPVRDQVLMTLMKLKCNRATADLSREFRVSPSEAAGIISHWIDRLDEVLWPLVPWPPRGSLQGGVPAAFEKSFPNTTCILGCSEILLEKPHKLGAGEEPRSRHNAVKYLVAVAPCGLIMFVSPVYGGRCGDKFIARDSGILDLLRPGDEVTVEAGFSIGDLLSEREVKVATPSLTKPHGALARAGTRVRRAVGCLKVYKILSQVVPTTLAPKTDKIVRVCAALFNLGEGPVSDAD